MITLFDPSFWFHLVVFFFAIFFAFFIPGDLALRKLQFSMFQRVVLSIILGMVLWGWQGFIFGYLHIRFLTYIYLSVLFILWILPLRHKQTVFKIQKVFLRKKIDLLLMLLVIVGMFIQLAPVLGFGLTYTNGVFLCCASRDDFLFHAALTQAIVKNIPPLEPGMSSVFVSNYHYWSNLVVAELIRIFHLPLFETEFQFITPLISFFLGASVIVFSDILAISKVFTRWLVFFVYFGSDAIFLLFLLLQKGLDKLRLVSSLEDGSTFLLNPPRAFSIVLAFAGLSLLAFWIKKKNKSALLFASIIFASTIGFKVYTGIFALMGFSCLIVFLLWKRRFAETLLISFLYPLGAIIYLSSNAKAGGLFWAPFYLANDFIVQPTFGLVRLELARQVFVVHKNMLRILQYELMFTAVFLLTLCGTKLIAFLQPFSSLLRLGKELVIFLGVGIVGSLFIGLLFLQASGGANTFNFAVSFWLFLSIPAALALEYWQKKISSRFKLLFVFCIVALTLPRIAVNTYSNVAEYLRFGYLFISNDELKAFEFIKNKTDKEALFIVDPNYATDINAPTVSAFTGRAMFLSGKGILDSHGINTENQALIKKQIFKDNQSTVVASNLLANNINYIVLWEEDSLPATESAYFTKTVFHNNAFSVLAIDHSLAQQFLKEYK